MRRALVVVALAGGLALAGAGSAGAHALLESATPARGATLRAAPGRVALRFNEPVEVAFGAVRVYDAEGSEVQTGSAFHAGGDARVVAVRPRPGLGHGGYTATYRVISADSHPVSGGFVFGVGSGGPASGKTVGDLLSGQGSGPVTSVAFAAMRALQYAAIALAIGALAVLVLAWLPALAALAAAAGGREAASAAFAARWRSVVLAAGVAGVVSGVLALARSGSSPPRPRCSSSSGPRASAPACSDGEQRAPMPTGGEKVRWVGPKNSDEPAPRVALTAPAAPSAGADQDALTEAGRPRIHVASPRHRDVQGGDPLRLSERLQGPDEGLDRQGQADQAQGRPAGAPALEPQRPGPTPRR